MMGTCKLCRQLVGGAPVGIVGPERVQAEFLALAEAMRLHVGVAHKDQLPVFGGLLTMGAQLFASLFADCALEDFQTGQESVRRFLADRFLDAEVVIQAGTPVNAPLVGPGVR